MSNHLINTIGKQKMILKKYFLTLFLLLLIGCNKQLTDFNSFEEKLISFTNVNNIPSISVAVISEGEIIYSNGIGYADIENKITATDSTPYRIASITKPIASSIILNLVESGILSLDEQLVNSWPNYISHFKELESIIFDKYPSFRNLIENYNFQDANITLRHQLSHTSERTPGESFRYSGFLYSQLSNLVDNTSEKNFHTLVNESIIEKLKMNRSLPQQNDAWKPDVIKSLAKPYYKNDSNNLILGNYPNPDLGAGAGIVSTVLDLAKFDIALDNNEILPPSMKKLAFTPTKLNNGNLAPYGLGWFIGEYKGNTIVYHTGVQPSAYSGIYVKIPVKELSLIILTNSEDFVNPYMVELGNGNIGAQPVVKMFLDEYL